MQDCTQFTGPWAQEAGGKANPPPNPRQTLLFRRRRKPTSSATPRMLRRAHREALARLLPSSPSFPPPHSYPPPIKTLASKTYLADNVLSQAFMAFWRPLGVSPRDSGFSSTPSHSKFHQSSHSSRSTRPPPHTDTPKKPDPTRPNPTHPTPPASPPLPAKIPGGPTHIPKHAILSKPLH